ncbi:MAG: hypothetical protein ACR2J9_00840 [Gaiellales bacterium]
MRRLLALLIVTIAGFALPALAAAQTAPAPTNVVLVASETTTISWDGAAGTTWQVVLLGKREAVALDPTKKRKLVVPWNEVIGAANWGQPITAYVAACGAPGESFDTTSVPGRELYTNCATGTVGTWGVSPTTTMQGPPSVQLVDAPGYRWQVERFPGAAPVTGFTVKWRPDNTTQKFKTKELKASARTFRVPGAGSGTYWEIWVIPHSAVGDGDTLKTGYYIS